MHMIILRKTRTKMWLSHVLAGALWTITLSRLVPFVSPETVPVTDQRDDQMQTCFNGQCFVTNDADVEVDDVDGDGDGDADSEADDYYHAEVRYIDIDFGEPQQVAGESWRETIAIINKTKDYMKRVRTSATFDNVRSDCRCRHELCSYWAAIGTSSLLNFLVRPNIRRKLFQPIAPF